MTDAEAKRLIEQLATEKKGPVVHALLHALTALADRAALVDAWNAGGMIEADAAARRHMRGDDPTSRKGQP